MRGSIPNDMSSTCAQGAIPRPFTGYHQPIMEPSSPAPAWQFHHSIIPKQEPVDQEERNDSGISGGDQSSSTESDHSESIRFSPPSITSPLDLGCYATPATQHQYTGLPLPFHNNRDLLSPPNLEPRASPKNLQYINLISNIEVKSEVNETTLTPCTSLEESSTQADNNALKQLQLTVEKNNFLPPSISPTSSENSGDKSEMDVDSTGDQAINVPKLNSHGKVRKFKCKQCNFVAITKAEFWEHCKTHLDEHKILSCQICPFVTTYKHHFEYHMRNHMGSKPFKCNQCNYTCVNKSMLNSHLKSHSEVYQYGCADCSYVTKYMHSLKVHLRKYKHKPDMVRNPDGTPNPVPIIDVYGTRRGPKMKSQKPRTLQENLPQPEPTAAPFPFNPFMLSAPQMQLPFTQLPFFAGFPGANPFLLPNLEALMRSNQELAPGNQNSSLENLKSPLAENQNASSENQEIPLAERNFENHFEQSQAEAEVLDLSKPPKQPVQKNRRKGRAFKRTPEHNSDSEHEELTYMFNNVEVVENIPAETVTREEQLEVPHNNIKKDYSCQFCLIDFADPIIYTIHMGYHGFQNPFTCNKCGEKYEDKVSFFLHIARNPHP